MSELERKSKKPKRRRRTTGIIKIRCLKTGTVIVHSKIGVVTKIGVVV